MCGRVALRALIWDVDGTLADTERDGHRVAFNAAFAESGPPFRGWHWSVAEYGRWLAVPGGKERVLAAWQKVDPVGAARPDAMPRVATLHAAKTGHYRRLIRCGAVQLRPGVERLLREARRDGVLLAIATTTTPANVDALLRHTLGDASPGWFACIAAGDVVARKKPAPDIHRHVLAELQLAPVQAVALEDSAVGAAAAIGAGVPTIVVRNDFTRDDAIDRTPQLLADVGGFDDLTLPALRALHAGAAMTVRRH